MVIGRSRFNIYLMILLAATGFGCRSTKEKDDPANQLSTLRLHLETRRSPMDFSISVPIVRASPVIVTVDKSPFLTELHLSEAKLREDSEGLSLELHFNQQGTWLLEEYTTSNPGRRVAIFTQFGDSVEQSRWLGAPRINRRISDGVLVFSPDASREELDRIILGLNNIVNDTLQKSKW